MISRTAFALAANRAYKLDSEKVQEHDFSNLVQEHRVSVERQDRRLIEYCECELGRMYRERRPRKR
jgi:hypothetical protein